MMSKKKWFALLTVFIIYLLLGASYFYYVESREEALHRQEAERERQEINETLYNLLQNTHPKTLTALLEEIDNYCEKPLLKPDTSPPHWDYYHSVFFAITVVTTIGYGNLAPTTSGSRIFMIAYGLIGIPVNGILFATLGEYFGKTFIRIYRKWKNNRMKLYAANLSLVSQIVLYLIPGLIIFLFLPAIVIQYFEDWDYVKSVYYAFVTLTTIGFGDYVAGVANRGVEEVYFVLYQVFLVVWIIFGLGYLVMVIGFMTRGLRSKKMARLEKHLTQNIKTTHTKIWQGFVKDFSYLRRIMNELYMARFKPVYKDTCSCATPPKIGSQSFPDLRKLISTEISPKAARRRAFSECISSRPLTRVQSDSDLRRIDKEATFANLELVQPSELLANVATALTKSTIHDPMSESEDEGGYHGFSDNEILASELYGSEWTLGSFEMPMQPPRAPRCRAASEVKIPVKFKQDNSNEWTWSGPAATQQIQELRRNKFNRARIRSREMPPKTIFEKIKNSWSRTIDEEFDVEKQNYPAWDNTIHSDNTYCAEPQQYLHRTRAGRPSVFSVPETRVLEETSVADLLRALSSIHSRVANTSEIAEPKRKLGIASLTPPKVPSITNLFNPLNQGSSRNPSHRPSIPRRTSTTPAPTAKRRFSLHPVSEDQLLTPPPPYSPTISLPPSQMNYAPPIPASLMQPQPSQVNNLVHKQLSRLRGPANARILYTRTRHNSLKDLRLEKP